MKIKIFICFLIAFIFVGCAGKGVPSLYMQTSSPIFITNLNKDANQSVYINFKNSSNQQNTLEKSVRAKLKQKGFVSSGDIKNADIVILGDLMSFERLTVKDPNIFLNVGYGFGSFGRRSSVGMGVFFGDPFYDRRTNSYVYRASVSLSIKTKEREQRTVLNVQSDRNVYSPSYIMPFIEDKISTQILNFFY